MSVKSFRRLLPAFKRIPFVHLQGWGEPLLHPEFFTLVALAKQMGCKVGTTTNGMLLDKERIALLLENKLDLIAFSLAGTSGIHDQIRKGTQIDRVLECIRRLDKAKKEYGVDRPVINIAYILLKSYLTELEGLPRILSGSGVDEVVVTTLDFIPSSTLEDEVIRSSSKKGYNRILAALDRTMRACSEQGIKVHYQIASPPPRRLTCTENLRRALFVSADGSVSPCVFTNIPVSDAIYRTDGCCHTFRPVVFGNINHEELSHIWWKREYRKFRDSFYTVDLPDSCKDCPKLRNTTL